MAFMKRQIQQGMWLRIDGTHGITFVPCKDVQLSEHNFDEENNVNDNSLHLLDDYYEGTIQSASIKVGYGARLSAPGYMDCTEWAVFDTEAEAIAYLDEDEDNGPCSDYDGPARLDGICECGYMHSEHGEVTGD